MLNLSDEVIESIADKIVSGMQSWQTKDGWETGTPGHEKFWNDYIKRVDPHEKKYKETIRGLLQEQADEVFENIKEYPNSPIMWQFDRVKSFRKIAEAEAKFVTQLYAQEGQKAIDLALKLAREQKGFKAEIGLAFDVNNPLVVEQLLKQTQRFPSGLIGTTEEDIRQAIATGISQGETIDQIADRVESKLSPSHILNRAELIARSEAIYAANADAELGYIQSGVVEGKQWLIAWDERTCDICYDMEGMTAPVGEATWEKEGMGIVDVQGKYGLDFDYTEGEMPHPPIHPRCRCTIVPILRHITGEGKPPTMEEIGKSVEGYQDGGYQSINGHLRGTEKLSPEVELAVKKDIKNISYAMKESKSDMYLFRGDGAGISADLFETVPGLPHGISAEEVLFGRIEGMTYNQYYQKKFVGKQFVDKAFLSTSKKMNVAQEFINGSTSLSKYGVSGYAEISIPKGTLLMDVEKYSTMGAGESEILLNKGLGFEITNLQFLPIQSGTSSEQRIYIKWWLKEVNIIKAYNKEYTEKVSDKIKKGRYIWKKGDIIILN